MDTTKTEVNKAEKGCGMHPGEELISAINLMLNERIPIKIVFAGDLGGDVIFSVKYSDLGITPQTLSHPFYRTHAFADTLGELIVRQNMELFADRLMKKPNYDTLIRSFSHRNFGLRDMKNEIWRFTFHASLYFHLQNEMLSQIISEEVAKLPPAVVRAKRIKRGKEPESIQTYTDSNGLKLTVPKTSELRVCLENAMETVLDFYGIKNKDVFISNNMFNFEFSITEKTK